MCMPSRSLRRVTFAPVAGAVIGVALSTQPARSAQSRGGDIPAFFNRYRARLERRDEIAEVSGLSPNDIERVLALYRAN